MFTRHYAHWPPGVPMSLPVPRTSLYYNLEVSARRGETVKAVVVLKAASRGRVREDDVISWAREHMAAFKVPRLVEFVEQLPKTATGKVFWRKLQEEENRRCAAG